MALPWNHLRGFRFFGNNRLPMVFPGQYGQVIPQMDTISIPPINKIERPSFRMRNIWYSGWMPVSDEDSEELTRWLDCNKANRLLISLPGDGTISRL